MAGELIFEYKAEGLEELIQKTNASVLIAPCVREFFNKSTAYAEREVKKNTPVDTGRLRSSITTEIDGALLPIYGKVGTNIFYAPFVELGTKPHFPPPAALERWAQLHGFGKGGGYIVARKIAKYGTPAREMFKKGFEASKGKIDQFLREACERIEEIWSSK